MSASATVHQNPLLQGSGLPTFTDITPDQVEPAFTQLLTELWKQLTILESSVEPTWSALVEPLEQLTERLSWSWRVLNHLMAVKNSPDL
ncbi:M3 family peptidase, partial [Cylindrospermopsis raciborskii CS-506_D]|nr:M3 family peptidase [Cylindrospermopsis raciborskii CS-506_D]